MMSPDSRYPAVLDENLVGTYDAKAHSGAGYVWDAVLEYRVWCCPENGAPDDFDGNDYYFAYVSYEAALAFSVETPGAEAPLALVLQEEHINESTPRRVPTRSRTTRHRVASRVSESTTA